MREILFRGKAVDGDKWVYGDLLTAKREEEKPICVIVEHTLLSGKHLCYENTIGQCVGLTDKNGKNVYEGDIIRYKTSLDKDAIGWIGYGKGCFRVWLTGASHPALDLIIEYFARDGIEVIGNVYDNPDLLKTSHEKNGVCGGWEWYGGAE